VHVSRNPIKEIYTCFEQEWMDSLFNTAFLSWENIFNEKLREKVNGTDIIFYDTQDFKFM
jgi:hypothetical protein